ncbi:hypothetical protein STAS_10881 [Striga asiatica]|uniref:Uncharacterized protein n=1 Tax=Striga asiatica TaxID=4170 RepID=A0A5A7PPG5_STRAF|nr:hypothetical protein STAS_10881 [Striga asiatica]
MQVSGVLPDVSAILTSAGGCRSQELKHFASFFDGKHFLSPGLPKNCLFPPNHKLEVGSEKLRTRSFMVRASGNYSGDFITVPPLKLESSVGELLAQIQQTHPHLLLASAEQQLENLQSQRDDQKEANALPAQDFLLYERIAKVKEKERRKTLEDIMYCLIVQRFLDNRISMIPKITLTTEPSRRIDLWPNQEHQLESVHSPEAFEMITSHLALVLGEQAVGPLDTIVHVSKIKLGKLYAASIMYGYFLRRVDERYQLERSMGTLPEGFGEEEEEEQAFRLDEPLSEKKQLWDPDSLIRIYPDDDDVAGVRDEGEKKSYKLRSYVTYLDGETLQRYATMRSGEAVSLIERQTQALFGRPDIKVSEYGSLDASNDEAVSLRVLGLTMLVLEAVAFGSFLWDMESFVEAKYPFVNS